MSPSFHLKRAKLRFSNSFIASCLSWSGVLPSFSFLNMGASHPAPHSLLVQFFLVFVQHRAECTLESDIVEFL